MMMGQKSMDKVLIGCPLYKREWILPDWLESIKRQNYPLKDLGFIFELGPNDEETHKILYDWHNANPEVFCFDTEIKGDEEHDQHPEGKRLWSWNKYHKMVRMRNRILDRVSCIEPDRYFSLDSDILLEHPDTILNLVNLTEKLPAVSPLMFMSPHTCEHPNSMFWDMSIGGKAKRDVTRTNMGSIFQSDIIMAAVMMSKPVYKEARYRFHKQGEDLGWSADCAHKGFLLYLASNIYTPHVMHRWMLDDWRAGNHLKNRNGLPNHLRSVFEVGS
jgi:hypothetical protein